MQKPGLLNKLYQNPQKSKLKNLQLIYSQILTLNAYKTKLWQLIFDPFNDNNNNIISQLLLNVQILVIENEFIMNN